MATIPHSGTSLTIRAFEDAGFAQMGVGEPMDRHMDEDRLRWSHLHEPKKRERVRELAEMGMPLVCPIRHPFRNYESHKHRSASETHLERMLLAWRACLKDIFPHALILPVDADAEVRHLHHVELQEALGIELPIDWKRIVNSKPPGRVDMPLEESRAPEVWQRLAGHPILKGIYG